jgi:hypothetical protein
MRPVKPSVKGPGRETANWPGKEWQRSVSTDIIAAVLVAAIFIVPLIVLGVLAQEFGVDSRPTESDRDHRPWLVPIR